MSDFYAQLEQQLIDAGRRRGERVRLRRTLAGRGRPLAAAAALAVAVVVAVVVLVAPVQRDVVQPGPAAPPAPPAAATNLRGIRVAVLNATTQPGAARATATVLEARHARIMAVGNAASQHAATTGVLFRRGALMKALRVGRVLGAGRVGPYRGTQRGVVRAEVIVLVGADRLDHATP